MSSGRSSGSIVISPSIADGRHHSSSMRQINLIRSVLDMQFILFINFPARRAHQLRLTARRVDRAQLEHSAGDGNAPVLDLRRHGPATGATAANNWRPSQAWTSTPIRSPSTVIRLYAFGSSRSRVEVAVAAWTTSGPDGVGSIGASTSDDPASGSATVGGPLLTSS